MGISSLFVASTWILPVLLAVTLHEAAHGWVAERFGDNTARLLGRVTCNPLKHIDKVGTIIIPCMLLLTKSPVLFGYAKPVPVNFRNLQPLRLGMFMVAIAGPTTNILLATVSAFMLNTGTAINQEGLSWLQLNLFNGVVINCALAVFNMVPILPLDGGRVLRAILPAKAGDQFASTERYGMFIVLGTIFIPPLLGINIVTDMLMFIDGWMIKSILIITQH